MIIERWEDPAKSEQEKVKARKTKLIEEMNDRLFRRDCERAGISPDSLASPALLAKLEGDDEDEGQTP